MSGCFFLKHGVLHGIKYSHCFAFLSRLDFAIGNPSAVVCLSVCNVRVLYSRVEPFAAIFLHHFVPYSHPLISMHAKYYSDRPIRGTPASGALNARGVAK